MFSSFSCVRRSIVYCLATCTPFAQTQKHLNLSIVYLRRNLEYSRLFTQYYVYEYGVYEWWATLRRAHNHSHSVRMAITSSSWLQNKFEYIFRFTSHWCDRHCWSCISLILYFLQFVNMCSEAQKKGHCHVGMRMPIETHSCNFVDSSCRHRHIHYIWRFVSSNVTRSSFSSTPHNHSTAHIQVGQVPDRVRCK